MVSCRYQVLGPLECLDAEGRRVELGDPLAAKLLALLLLAANQPVSPHALIDGLWARARASAGSRRRWSACGR